ncbi:DUF7344 domain-containing protein [Haladaptatus halobius]|uniref:DUF7344 domain-containing protein n=1 Tax=Haladaptatus halobius TaxID=2884875 RepID=UPI003F602ECB
MVSPNSSLTGANDSAPSTEGLTEILRNRQRRAICKCLNSTPDGTLDELLDQLCQRTPVKETDSAERHRLRIRLHHVHLPFLADLGVLEYDHRRQTIHYRGHPHLDHLLE